jgi:hypothetical protein
MFHDKISYLQGVLIYLFVLNRIKSASVSPNKNEVILFHKCCYYYFKSLIIYVN